MEDRDLLTSGLVQMHKSDTVYENKHRHRHENLPKTKFCGTTQTCRANKGGRRAVLNLNDWYNVPMYILSLILIYRCLWLTHMHTLGIQRVCIQCANCRQLNFYSGASLNGPSQKRTTSLERTHTKAPINFSMLLRRGKLNSQFIVTRFSILHAGGRSLLRFHISPTATFSMIARDKKLTRLCSPTFGDLRRS